MKENNMTNEEKALKIVNDSTLRDPVDGFGIALKMAQWKEQQTKSKLQEAFGCMIFRQDHSLSNKEHQYIDLDIVQNIIESFFHIKLDENGE